MLNQVLIVAGEAAARTPAEIARSLQCTPVIARSEEEAFRLIDEQAFRLIAVSGNSAWQRLRLAAERKQPDAKVLQLPDGSGEDVSQIRLLMARHLERPRVHSLILEAFSTAGDPREVLRNIVTIAREEFNADRAWLLYAPNEEAEFAKVVFSAGTGDAADRGPLPLGGSRRLIRRALERREPLVVKRGDPDLDAEVAKRFEVRSEILQVLRRDGGELWVFGMHQSSAVRDWTDDEVAVFAEIGRYATIALESVLLHDRAARETSKVNALLDQIPEAAAIFDASGRIERMNAAAKREPPAILDGTIVGNEESPALRAVRGDAVRADYVVRDPRTNDERVLNFKAAPIRDDRGKIIGSVVLSRDVTDERQNAEREAWRRRRAECLANLGLETISVLPSFDDLDEPARRIAEAIGGTVQILLYNSASGALNLVGFSSDQPDGPRVREYFRAHPHRPGEGLPGTVFQIGRPLLFYEIRGNAVLDYARNDEEKLVKGMLREQSLIAFPIEAYGERVGAVILSQSDPRRNFDAEDLEFAQAVAERIGAASHVQHLTRMWQEGHRAAEELARREVDARVRLEAVLETAPVGIAVVSADELRFELANARFVDFAARYGKISADTKVVGLRGDEVIPGFERQLKQVADSGEARVDEALEIRGARGSAFVNRIISAVRGRFSGVTQSVTVLVQDVTEQLLEQREIAERETRRRRRAECLASLGLETITVETPFEDLNEPARRVAQAIGGTAHIYFYRPQSNDLYGVGFATVASNADRFLEFIDHLGDNPYRVGEGLPGTVFQIGQPLLFADVKGDALVDFARTSEERRLIASLHEQTLIATPVESYGDRIGTLVISRSEEGREFDAEDLEFARSIADRIGAASHIHRLTSVSQEGHRAAEELARREVDARVRFEAVLETAPVGIAVISADELRFELANARFMEYAGHFGKIASDTKVIGLRGDEVIPEFERVLKQVADSGETRFDEALELPTRAGSIYVNRIISAARGRFSGITQSLTVLTQDVTEQVRAKREIEALAQMMAERSARLDSILGSMTDGLWVYDANAKVVDVNQAALAMFGLGSRTEAVELGSFEKFRIRYADGRPVPREDLPYARALRGMTVPDYLAIGRHLITGKDLDLSIAAAPIESGGIVGAVLVIRDITALQELDRKKDEFLSVASHELRTPLTTIKGYTQLLAQTGGDLPAEERSTYLNAVLGEIDRMMGLISELLDVSRIETNRLQIHPQPIKWLEFIERRAYAFRVQHPSRTILVETGTPEIVIHADPDRIRQVIDNIISNAVKYSPEGSEIRVKLELENGRIATAVIDQGIGIPQDEIPQLFERFHRARNVSSRYYGGLGLGLYIARAIVEAHHGTIRVFSEEGHGSVFTVTLPLS
jgi:PAS domain S-box-containing protein